MPQSPEEMAASMIRNLKEKTGRTLPQWLKLTKAAGMEKHGQIVKMLKSEHGITHGFASLIAHKHLEAAGGGAPGEADDPVAAQYSGRKAELRPLYDALVREIRKLGGDVEIAPKKTYVSLRRSKQFGIIQPSTATRIDVGINLKGAKATKRLEASGTFNQMVSHRVRIAGRAEVNAELIDWLRKAYESS